ncbi:MAG: DUF3179 domain-containing protein [Alphaproteobacteria bacterium]
MTRWLACLALLVGLARPAAAQLNDNQVLLDSLDLVFGDAASAPTALEALVANGDPRVAHNLILTMRYTFLPPQAMRDALSRLTGVPDRGGWFEWMVWRERETGLAPHPSFPALQRTVLEAIDPRFAAFLPDGVAHEIRLEEIVWGGVKVDGIPALVNAAQVPADEAGYLRDEDLVFGVAIDGDARAYPLRILDWHEMFNDVVGGVPVSLAYCTLCGAGILFETTVAGRDAPFTFGSSGLLYRSNKLMYDHQTGSLWNQFTGRPVVGPLTGSGIELAIRPVAITSWAAWRDANPDTTVLSLDTGYQRDYAPGAAYADYFASPDLMFPAVVAEGGLAAKDFVFGIRAPGGAKAWPLSVFAGGRVINDRVGFSDVVLVGDAATRTVRAYAREGRDFAADGGLDRLAADGQGWTVTEDALVGDDGATLPRVAGHVAYWFAWAGYLRETELYAGD